MCVCVFVAAMQVGIDRVTTIGGDDLQLTVSAKKKTVFRAGSLTKRDLRSRTHLVVRHGTSCSCTRQLLQLKKNTSDTYLVMGRREQDSNGGARGGSAAAASSSDAGGGGTGRLTANFVVRVDRKSRDMQRALRAIADDAECRNGRDVIETMPAEVFDDVTVQAAAASDMNTSTTPAAPGYSPTTVACRPQRGRKAQKCVKPGGRTRKPKKTTTPTAAAAGGEVVAASSPRPMTSSTATSTGGGNKKPRKTGGSRSVGRTFAFEAFV